MFKSQDILLICIIVILIIVICYCKNNKKEGFVSTEIFSPANLKTVSEEIENEIKEIDIIKGKFNDIIKRNKIQYYIENIDDNTYRKATKDEIENKETTKIELGELIDINNMVKLNSDLGKKLKNIPYNKYYEETVKGAIQKRIDIINGEIIKKKQEEILEEIKLNDYPITNIKHIDTSVMFDLQPVKDKKDIYKVNYINDNNNSDGSNNSDNSNNSKKCSNKCLTFNTDKYSDENSDYYSFEDCEDNKVTQNLKVNNIRLDYKCYKNNKVCFNKNTKEKVTDKTIKECEDDKDKYIIRYEEDVTGKSISDCYKDLKTHLDYDKNSYVKNYNALLTHKDKDNIDIVSPVSITENNLQFLPADFAVITPMNQPANEPKQCLTVDNEGLSFQDCDLFEHQRFNYERDIVDEEDGE